MRKKIFYIVMFLLDVMFLYFMVCFAWLFVGLFSIYFFDKDIFDIVHTLTNYAYKD